MTLNKSQFSPLPTGTLHITALIQKGRKNYYYSKQAVSEVTSSCFSIFAAFNSHLQFFFIPRSQEMLQQWGISGIQSNPERSYHCLEPAYNSSFSNGFYCLLSLLCSSVAASGYPGAAIHLCCIAAHWGPQISIGLLQATHFSLSEVLMNIFCIFSHSQSYGISHVILGLGLEGCVHYHRRS